MIGHSKYQLCFKSIENVNLFYEHVLLAFNNPTYEAAPYKTFSKIYSSILFFFHELQTKFSNIVKYVLLTSTNESTICL